MTVRSLLRRCWPAKAIPRRCWYCERIFYLWMRADDEASFMEAHYCPECRR